MKWPMTIKISLPEPRNKFFNGPRFLVSLTESFISDFYIKRQNFEDAARQLTKSMMRRDVINQLISQRESDTEQFLNFASKDFVQKGLKIYLESLKKKK